VKKRNQFFVLTPKKDLCPDLVPGSDEEETPVIKPAVKRRINAILLTDGESEDEAPPSKKLIVGKVIYARKPLVCYSDSDND